MEMRISNNLLYVNSTNLSAHLAVNKIILKDNNQSRRPGFRSKWEDRKRVEGRDIFFGVSSRSSYRSSQNRSTSASSALVVGS